MRIEYSFIIPAYNCSDYIERCIKSITEQKKNCLYEIIIVDDGSTDLLEDKVNELKQKYVNVIKYYKKENAGVSATRNFGINKSSGEYIIFVDGDDELCDDFFVNSEKLTTDSLYDVIKTKVLCEEDKEYDGRFELPIFEKSLNGEDAISTFCNSYKIFATPWSYILKRKYIVDKKLYFEEGTLHEDYGLMPLIIAKAESVISVNWYGYKYIKRKNSLSTLNTDSIETERMSYFINHTKNLIEYFCNNLSDDKKKIVCNYFYERLKVKIGNLNYRVKKELDYSVLNKITCMYNEIMDEIKISDLIGNHGETISNLLESAKNVFKSNLVCVLLGGSCGKNNNIIGWSDIDIYIILKEYDINMVQQFNLFADSCDIHVGITFYTLLEIEKKMIDSKTKVMLYEKELFHFNPTLYGYCNFPKISYDEIIENDINNLPNVLHEVRRMYINILNKKTKIEKKFVKKMLLLLKCYLNTKHIFIYGYENVTLEFLKLYNKNCSTNGYGFDIIKVISNLEKYEEDMMDFSKLVLKFIENEEMI